MDAKAVAEEAVAELRRRADPERRARTAGYFPTSLEILGISAPRQREVLETVAERLGDELPDSVLGEGNDSWASVDTFAVNLSGPAWRDGPLGDALVRREVGNKLRTGRKNPRRRG